MTEDISKKINKHNTLTDGYIPDTGKAIMYPNKRTKKNNSNSKRVKLEK